PALRHQHIDLPKLRNNLFRCMPLPCHRSHPPSEKYTSGRTTSKGADHRPYRAGPSYHYGYRPAYRHYGYRARPVVRYGYAPRFYGPRHSYMHGPRVRYAPQIGTRGYPLRYKF
ncbi:MAG: hypothetical protein NTZ72_02910, partial [Afipia sp.]|nr:hypothetical protein [Afipia sp.]